MYRPEGWFNSFTVEAGNLHPEAEKESNIYEAGDDAMLGALKAEAKRITSLKVLSAEHFLQAFGEGTWVFIPEEML